MIVIKLKNEKIYYLINPIFRGRGIKAKYITKDGFFVDKPGFFLFEDIIETQFVNNNENNLR